MCLSHPTEKVTRSYYPFFREHPRLQHTHGVPLTFSSLLNVPGRCRVTEAPLTLSSVYLQACRCHGTPAPATASPQSCGWCQSVVSASSSPSTARSTPQPPSLLYRYDGGGLVPLASLLQHTIDFNNCMAL